MNPEVAVTNRERGFASFGVYCGLAVVGIVLYLGSQFLPVYLNNYQFQNELSQIAFDSGRTLDKPVESIESEVMVKARHRGITLQPEDVEVRKDGYKVDIVVRYTTVVDLPKYAVELHFQLKAGHNVVSELRPGH